jgi:serine/threonine-protein kinase RsbW
MHWAQLDEGTAASAELVLGELLANAIQHGSPDPLGNIVACWCLGEALVVISVHDSGHVDHLSPRTMTTDGVGGRGLALLDIFCDQWILESIGGTRVIAEIKVEQRPQSRPEAEA